MKKRLPLTDTTGEVRTLTAADAKHAVSFHQLPTNLKTMIKRRGRGAQKAPTKERISIRLSPEVVDHFRAMGSGWQTAMDNALREWSNLR